MCGQGFVLARHIRPVQRVARAVHAHVRVHRALAGVHRALASPSGYFAVGAPRHPLRRRLGGLQCELLRAHVSARALLSARAGLLRDVLCARVPLLAQLRAHLLSQPVPQLDIQAPVCRNDVRMLPIHPTLHRRQQTVGGAHKQRVEQTSTSIGSQPAAKSHPIMILLADEK